MLRFVIFFPLMALVLFGSAGTIYWPEAWIFMIGQFSLSIVLIAWLKKNDPDLLHE